MSVGSRSDSGVTQELVDAIRSFPAERDVEHCGGRFSVSPFDFYASCPQCGARLKLRGMSAAAEIEDLFDAVFGWLGDPTARQAADRRQQALRADRDDDD